MFREKSTGGSLGSSNGSEAATGSSANKAPVALVRMMRANKSLEDGAVIQSQVFREQIVEASSGQARKLPISQDPMTPR